MRASVAGLAVGVLVASSAYAQYMISAHSGVVQYVEGSAFLNDDRVEPKVGQFPNIKENQVFRTEEGKAEVLLTPGVFLRLGENSSVRMVSTRLTDTRVEVLSGSAMVECDDLAKDNAIMLLYKGNSMLLVKHGLYRMDADAGLFKVYDGEAIVKGESGQLTLHRGKDTLLNGALMAENFDPKADDELYRWSDRRSGYLAKANVSSANGLSNGFSGYGGYGGYGGWNGWQFNPMFGMYTYVPYDGYLFSPFGYGFYSPYSVWQAPYNYYGGGGGSGVSGVSRSGSSSGKHTPFIPTRGSSASRGAVSASHGGAASSSGGGAARGSSGFSGGAAHAAASSGGASHGR
jgi:hypothetical protein